MSILRKRDQHQRARELIFQSHAESVSREQDAWLASHLDSCAPCSGEMDSLGQDLRDLNSIARSITADTTLVRSTQFRVRMRARELRQQDELMHPLWIAALMTFAWAVVSVPFLWAGFQWLGQQNNLPAMIWVSGFVVMCLTPIAAVSTVAIAKRHRTQHSHGVLN